MRGVVHSLAVDHSHTTGEVRGLLCRSCNQMLGLAHDSIETLKRAAEYLTKNVSRDHGYKKDKEDDAKDKSSTRWNLSKQDHFDTSLSDSIITK